MSSGQVSPGSVVTIRGAGFTPGEQVVVVLGGMTAPLATVIADERGDIEAVVQIPDAAILGPATVRLLGEESQRSTQVGLDVSALETPDAVGRALWPLLVTGFVLLVIAAALAAAAVRRPRRDDWTPPGAQR